MMDGEFDPIEMIARRMATAVGQDPDELIPETGYRDAKLIPAWVHQRDDAAKFFAAFKAMQELAKD